MTSWVTEQGFGTDHSLFGGEWPTGSFWIRRYLIGVDLVSRPIMTNLLEMLFKKKSRNYLVRCCIY